MVWMSEYIVEEKILAWEVGHVYKSFGLVLCVSMALCSLISWLGKWRETSCCHCQLNNTTTRETAEESVKVTKSEQGQNKDRTKDEQF